MADKQNIKEHLHRGDITLIAKRAKLTRSYVSEYVNDPSNWKGSPAAETAILNALSELIESRNKAHMRLAKLLNEAEA